MDLKRFLSPRAVLPLAVLAIGSSLPLSSSAAPPQIEAPSLVAPSLGCGAAPASAVLMSRVTARRHRQQPPRRHRHHHAEAAPAPVEEGLPTLAHAFYSCSETPLTAIPVGTGWLAVGPVRRS